MKWWIVLLGGCFAPSSETCGDLVCAEGRVCTPDHSRCVSPEQVSSCAGAADGAACTADTMPGTCKAGVCEYPFCGNGIRELGEQCDGADLGGADCTTIARPFYNRAGLGCTADCQFDSTGCTGFCGDHVVNGPELCDGAPPTGVGCFDFGYDVGAIGCSAGCFPDLTSCGNLGWTPVPIASGADFYGVWASGQRDVYVVGGTTNAPVALHYDGTAWTPIATGAQYELLTATGTGPDDVFLGGVASALVHWNGTSWSAMSSRFAGANINRLWAVAPGNVFAAGGNTSGLISHYDGTAWTLMTIPSSPALQSIWARDASEAWAVVGSTVLQYDGTSWSSVAAPSGATALKSVTGAGTTDVYVSDFLNGYHWTGAAWQGPANNAGPVLASGGAGVFAATITTFEPISALAPDGTSWMHTVPTPRTALSSIGGDAAGHLWGVGPAGTLVRYRGASWNGLGASGSYFPTAVWEADPQHVFAANATFIVPCSLYRGGSAWSSAVSCANGLRALWGSSAADVYAVGANGAITHTTDGATWSAMTSGVSGTLNAIWGSSASDIYVVGASGVVLHSSGGGAWAQTAIGVASDDLNGIWGSDASHIFVIGSGGRLLRFDGATWTQEVVGQGASFAAIWGASPTDVWAVGPAGKLVHYDGTSWTLVPSGTTIDLRAVWGTATNDVFAGGDASTLLHYDGKAWSPIRILSANNSTNNGVGTVTSISGDGRHIFFGSINSMIDRVAFPPAGCSASETSCGDAIDDDCDFLVDCDDPDCRGSAACGP